VRAADAATGGRLGGRGRTPRKLGHRHRRNESYHIQKWMRMPERDESDKPKPLDPSLPLRLVSRGQVETGRAGQLHVRTARGFLGQDAALRRRRRRCRPRPPKPPTTPRRKREESSARSGSVKRQHRRQKKRRGRHRRRRIRPPAAHRHRRRRARPPAAHRHCRRRVRPSDRHRPQQRWHVRR